MTSRGKIQQTGYEESEGQLVIVGKTLATSKIPQEVSTRKRKRCLRQISLISKRLLLRTH